MSDQPLPERSDAADQLLAAMNRGLVTNRGLAAAAVKPPRGPEVGNRWLADVFAASFGFDHRLSAELVNDLSNALVVLLDYHDNRKGSE